MQLENTFTVPASPDKVWTYLLDVERVVPCMPGAEITGVVDEKTWKGKVSVKLGPVSLSFAGALQMEEADESGKRVVLKAKGTETRGKGAISATVTSRLEPAEGGTKVAIVTDLTISGAVAHYGRGMIADVSQKFTDQFAQCLAAQLGNSGDGATGEAQPPAPQAVSGVQLGLCALWRALGRGFRRLVPGSSRES